MNLQTTGTGKDTNQSLVDQSLVALEAEAGYARDMGGCLR
jgi:hypothetical protein